MDVLYASHEPDHRISSLAFELRQRKTEIPRDGRPRLTKNVAAEQNGQVTTSASRLDFGGHGVHRCKGSIHQCPCNANSAAMMICCAFGLEHQGVSTKLAIVTEMAQQVPGGTIRRKRRVGVRHARSTIPGVRKVTLAAVLTRVNFSTPERMGRFEAHSTIRAAARRQSVASRSRRPRISAALSTRSTSPTDSPA